MTDKNLNFWETRLGKFIIVHGPGIEEELRQTTGDNFPPPEILESCVAFDQTFHTTAPQNIKETIDKALKDYRTLWERKRPKQKTRSLVEDPPKKKSAKVSGYVIFGTLLFGAFYFFIDILEIQMIGSVIIGLLWGLMAKLENN